MSADDDVRTAMGHHQAGRLDRAESFYRKALRRVPDHADALHLFGVLEFGRGNYGEANRLISLAVRSLPAFAPAHMNLGNAQNAAGDRGAAEASYRRAIAIDPALAGAHVNLAMLLNDRGQPVAAEASCRAALVAQPGLLEAHITLAIALRAQRRLPEADAEYRRAIALRPDRPGTLSDHGTLLGEMGRFNEALERHERAIGLAPDMAGLHGALGGTLALLGDLAGAERAFGRLLALAPLDLSGWLVRGGALSGLGRFEEAKACFDRVLGADAARAEAHWRLSLIDGLSTEAETAARLTHHLADETVAPMGRVFAGFALAAAHEKSGDYDAAFNAADTANRLFRDLRAITGLRFDPDGFDADIDRVIAATPREIFTTTQAWGDPSELPVFIAGMPRSGTTLVDQILASHPQVHCAGGLGRIAQLNMALMEANRDKASLADWDAELAHRAAAEHVVGLAAMAGGKARVVDRTPDNVLQLGLIAALFPHARVVLCTRDARDVCISNFFQLFIDGNLFGRDLAHCARRQRAVARLVAHWHDVLPLRMHEIAYEKLIAEPEDEIRGLVEFLGLDWDPACLNFHRTERAITTPAMWQVRQRLYAGSVGRWRRYERQIGAIAELA